MKLLLIILCLIGALILFIALFVAIPAIFRYLVTVFKIKYYEIKSLGDKREVNEMKKREEEEGSKVSENIAKGAHVQEDEADLDISFQD